MVQQLLADLKQMPELLHLDNFGKKSPFRRTCPIIRPSLTLMPPSATLGKRHLPTKSGSFLCHPVSINTSAHRLASASPSWYLPKLAEPATALMPSGVAPAPSRPRRSSPGLLSKWRQLLSQRQPRRPCSYPEPISSMSNPSVLSFISPASYDRFTASTVVMSSQPRACSKLRWSLRSLP